METNPPHMVILPSPGMGHLIPMVEFAKKLHGVATTFLIPTHGPLPKAQQSFLSALPPALDHLLLPPVSSDDLSADVNIERRICLNITRSLPSIHGAVKSLHESKNVVAFVVDLFGTDALDVASEFDIPSYIFQCSTAMAVCMFLHLLELDKTVSCEYREVQEKLQIPGCIPIHGKDLPDPVQDRKDDAYKLILHHAKRYRLVHGVLLNSFKELEPGPIEALLKEDGRPVVYPIGPLIKMGSKEFTEDDDSCVSLKWLDDQPSGSVLYVSFGSTGTLSHDQIIELASGLEMSEHRFLWVIRCPNDTTSNAAYVNNKDLGDPLAYLPQG